MKMITIQSKTIKDLRGRSKIECAILEYIKSVNNKTHIIINDRTIIYPLELDI
jgi:hypothetical protein